MRCSQLCMQEAFEARYVSLHVRESNKAAFHLYKTTLGYQVLLQIAKTEVFNPKSAASTFVLNHISCYQRACETTSSLRCTFVRLDRGVFVSHMFFSAKCTQYILSYQHVQRLWVRHISALACREPQPLINLQIHLLLVPR